MRAFVFPGQGAQSIGMGRDLAEAYPSAARTVFDAVDAALGEDLSGLIWSGDAETLTLTRNAQPALMATSIAALRALEAEGVDRGARRPPSSPVIRWANIPPSWPRARLGSRTPRACCEYAARRCRMPCPRARARWRRSWVSTSKPRVRSRTEAAQGDQVCDGGQRQRPGAGGRVGRDRDAVIARHGTGQGPGRQARGDAARFRPVPLRIDGRPPPASWPRRWTTWRSVQAPSVPRRHQYRPRRRRATPPISARSWCGQVDGCGALARERGGAWPSDGVTEIWEVGAGKALSGMVRRIDRSLATRTVGTPDEVAQAAASLKE